MTHPTPAFTPATRLDCCGIYTWNDPADHRCPTYDGPACQVCGAGTLTTPVGAPGIGTVTECRRGHRDSNARILTPAEVA